MCLLPRASVRVKPRSVREVTFEIVMFRSGVIVGVSRVRSCDGMMTLSLRERDLVVILTVCREITCDE